MSRTFRLTDAAKDDLLEVWGYVFSHQHDNRRADAAVEELYETFALLAENPNIGTPRARLPGGRLAFPKNGYLIVYVLLDGEIEITRVSGGDEALIA